MYVILERNQASRQVTVAVTDVFDNEADASELADDLQADAKSRGRGETYTVHSLNDSEDDE